MKEKVSSFVTAQVEFVILKEYFIVKKKSSIRDKVFIWDGINIPDILKNRVAINQENRSLEILANLEGNQPSIPVGECVAYEYNENAPGEINIWPKTNWRETLIQKEDGTFIEKEQLGIGAFIQEGIIPKFIINSNYKLSVDRFGEIGVVSPSGKRYYGPAGSSIFFKHGDSISIIDINTDSSERYCIVTTDCDGKECEIPLRNFGYRYNESSLTERKDN